MLKILTYFTTLIPFLDIFTKLIIYLRMQQGKIIIPNKKNNSSDLHLFRELTRNIDTPETSLFSWSGKSVTLIDTVK